MIIAFLKRLGNAIVRRYLRNIDSGPSKEFHPYFDNVSVVSGGAIMRYIINLVQLREHHPVYGEEIDFLIYLKLFLLQLIEQKKQAKLLNVVVGKDFHLD